MGKWVGSILWGLVFIFGSVEAMAEGSALSETVAQGKIDWAKKTITVTGSGAPSLKAANVAVARLGAQKAAEMDALRKIVEAVKGVRIKTGTSAGNLMDTAPEVKAKVQGVVRNWRVLDTRYFSDGGVELVVQVSLDGVLVETLIPDAGSKASKAVPKPGGNTGLVINAKGLGISPALAPRIVDDKGKEIYSAALVKADAVRSRGVAGYKVSLDSAIKDPRVADNPLIIRAQKAGSSGGSDVVISTVDGAKLAGLSGVLVEGRVIIVTD